MKEQSVFLKRATLLKRIKNIAPVRLIAISFLLVIVLGTLLLMLPISARSGNPTNPVDAFFVATSATCVTGLVPFDTYNHWNVFGQIVILLLIQIGGLGLVTFTSGINILLRRRLGLRDRQIASENTGGGIIDITHLIRVVFVFTFTCELIGAALLMLRFVPKFGAQGIWISVFLAVSGYCNAGFDILGFELRDGSLTRYVSDPLVCLVIAGLIIIGGLGFIVIREIYAAQISPRLHKQKCSHLSLHSYIVLRMSVILLVLGTVLFLIFEYNNTLKGLNFGGKLNAAFFQSASARTAGFASVDIAAERDITKIITSILMFIGASPAGTGGGIKTTTFVVLAATVLSVVRGHDETVLHKRRVDKRIVYRALAIFTFAFLLVLVTTTVILITNPGDSIGAVDALFEATSAFGTVGLTAGVTPHLSAISKVVVALTMFIGRVGPVSLAIALSIRGGRRGGSILPEGKIIVG